MAEQPYRWRFLGSEGCARCQAMDGYYEKEPTPPHPHCRCQIIDLATAGGGTGCPQWWPEAEPTVRDANGSTLVIT